VLGNELSLMPHPGQAGIFVNVARISDEFAIACIVNDRCYGRGVYTPLTLRISELHSLNPVTESGGDQSSVENLREVVAMLLTASLVHGCSDKDAFVRHMVIALCAIHDRNKVEMARPLETVPGGLKPWQKAVAKQMLGGCRLSGNTLLDVAQACGLSTPHFGRAFNKSFGVPPHRWLLIQRLEKAKTLLMELDRSLADIAYECGFCDQSHLCHSFSRRFGVSPGAWRKRHERECEITQLVSSTR
jgi:AraC-like DNA-binding protein